MDQEKISYPKGSEWRKWNLHVHTPLSIIQNYGGDTEVVWNKYIKCLSALPSEIAAIAVTDYLFIDGYERLLVRRSEFPNIKLLIPNIEFRLDIFSGTENNTKRLNFHVLFDPSVSVGIIREQLLNCLSKAYLIEDGSEWQQAPTVRSLEELGRKIKRAAPGGHSVQSKSDLEVGFSNITYKKEDIIELLKKDCFKGKYVTAIGYSEWSQFRWDQSAAEKRTLINDSNFCLTSVDNVQKISEHVEELKKNKLNSLILHSSDAHEFDKLGKTNTWIKADPTFAGLKQVLNEPEARVFIGETPPNYKHSHQVISKLKISNSNGWFANNFQIELNRDLVTVIGGRGSGKSALIEMIAYGAGSFDRSPDSFVKKASQHKENIDGIKVCLIWEDSTETCFNIGQLKEDKNLIRYLPQKAVEQLCAPANDTELQDQIENVIFQSLEETEKLGVSNFDELRKEVLRSFQQEKDRTAKKIRDINKNISILRKSVKELPEKKKKLELDKKQLKKLEDTLPILPMEDTAGQEELARLYELKIKFEEKIISLKNQLRVPNEIRTKVRLFQEQIRAHEYELIELAKALGITDTDIFKIEVKTGHIDSVLITKEQEIQKHIDNLKTGDEKTNLELLGLNKDELLFPNIEKLTIEIEKKVKNTKAFETEKIKYQKQKEAIITLNKQIGAAEKEVKKIEEEVIPRIGEQEKERLIVYSAYFNLLGHEKEEIEKLYQPLQKTLLQGTDTDKRLKFEAKLTYDLEQHLTQGLQIIDRTRKGNFREIETLRNALKGLWSKFLKVDFSTAAVQSEINNLLARFTECEDGSKFEIKEQLRETYGTEDFDNWLFSVSYFIVTSSLTFDGTDLHLLSPGQKGIVLLMLYLEIDKEDTRPLIIDQPEDNLDSLSVYNDLIDFFRDRKQYRQIIMVTHNPNLVVNTDAEQVIVANYAGDRKPRLQYASGSLEDQVKENPSLATEDMENGIIEHVCNILEGGDKAFDRRKQKYQISLKNFKYKK